MISKKENKVKNLNTIIGGLVYMSKVMCVHIFLAFQVVVTAIHFALSSFELTEGVIAAIIAWAIIDTGIFLFLLFGSISVVINSAKAEMDYDR